MWNKLGFISGIALIAGLLVFLPGRAMADATVPLGYCGIDCPLSCCQASGIGCSCSCDASGAGVCDCWWDY